MTIAVSYHETVNVLQGLNWVAASPFARAEWFALLAASATRPVLVALAQDERGAMAALPLIQAETRLEPLANWYSFIFTPLLSEGADAAALLHAVARDLQRHARRVTLWPLGAEDGMASDIESAFKRAGWTCFLTNCDINHILPVAGRSYAEYLATRPGPLRTTLKRKSKRIEVRIITFFDDDTWNIYEDIYAHSWKPSEGDPRLLRAFARQEGCAGRLRMALGIHEGRPVAAQLWTVEAGTAWIHKLAHRQDADHLSAGSVLTAALMEQVIDRDGVALVDFGTVDDPYKTDWMDEKRVRFRLDCHNPKTVASWPHIARAALRRLATRSSAG